MTTQCTFVQISDLHLLADRQQLFQHINPYQHLLQAIDQINRLDPAPDFVLLNGDLVNEETVEAYEVLADDIKRIRFPLYYALGNHDNRELFRKVFGEAFFQVNDFCAYHFMIKECCCVVFDSLYPGTVNGYIGHKQIQWCHDLLKQEDRPTFVFLHHPPLPIGIPWIDELLLSNSSEFLDLVATYPHIQGVFCGHVHRYHVLWHGRVPIISSPALSVRFGPDPETKIVPGPPGFLVVSLDNNHLEVTPHFFSGAVPLSKQEGIHLAHEEEGIREQ